MRRRSSARAVSLFPDRAGLDAGARTISSPCRPPTTQTRGYFPIEGDRIVAYDIVTATQQWLVTARPQMQPVAGDGLLFLVEPDALTALNAERRLGRVAAAVRREARRSRRSGTTAGWCSRPRSARCSRSARPTATSSGASDLESPAHAPPALAADRVYVPTDDGRIVALRVETGEPLWERRLGGAPNDILALDERLYVGRDDNFFYCLMAKDGARRLALADRRRRHRPADRRRRPRVFRRRSTTSCARSICKSGDQQWMRPLPLRPAWGPAKAGTTIVVAGLNASAAGVRHEGRQAGRRNAGRRRSVGAAARVR